MKNLLRKLTCLLLILVLGAGTIIALPGSKKREDAGSKMNKAADKVGKAAEEAGDKIGKAL